MKTISDVDLISSVRVHAERSKAEGWYARANYMNEIADRYENSLKTVRAMIEEKLDECCMGGRKSFGCCS
jgi:hypothetical protein